MPRYVLGVRGHDYGKGDVKEIFSRIKQDGWECTQLAIRKLVAGVNSYEEITPEVVAAVQAAMREVELDIAVLGTYVELGSLDPARRQKDVADFISQIPVCKTLGASCMGSETTHFDEKNGNVTRDDAVKELLKSLDAIMPEAERHGVVVALEPVWVHTMNTVETTRKVIDSIKSPNLKIIFDPANMLSPQWADKQDDLYKRAMDSWGSLITAVHFKHVNSGVDYRAVFNTLNELPQQIIPVLREGADPTIPQQEQEMMLQFM